jgi:glutamyl/glutaminyl-tRNA synthetase
LPRLQKTAEILSTIGENLSPDEIRETLWSYAEKVGKGEVLWPLRVALSGRERSPDPFTIIYIIGSAEAYKRVRKACDTILSA